MAVMKAPTVSKKNFGNEGRVGKVGLVVAIEMLVLQSLLVV